MWTMLPSPRMEHEMEIRVMCVHGAGESAAVWRPQVNGLREVEAVDLPGHGGTDGPGFESVAAYAAWVSERLAGSQPLILAGHSMGGAIAQYLGLHRELSPWLAGLILAGTGARLRVHPDIFALLDTDFDAAIARIVEWSVGDPLRDDVAAVLTRSMRQAGRDVVRDDLRACNVFDAMDVAREIDVPALLIAGSEDRMTPPKYSVFLEQRIPKSELVLVASAGHMVMLERPEETSQAIQAFRSGLPRSRSRGLDPGCSVQ